MMFMFHSAMMLALIAIALGIGLIVWALRNEGRGVVLAKVFGWLIVIFAVLAMLCSTYYAMSYWQSGYFQMPMGMMKMMQGNSMPNGGDMHQNMMQGQ